MVSRVLSNLNLFSSPSPSTLTNHHHQQQLNPTSCQAFSSSSSSSSSSSVKLKSQALKSQFNGRKFLLQETNQCFFKRGNFSLKAALRYPKAQRWWEKGLQPNMKEIISTQDLVDSLLNAGDQLVIIDFFAPSCGGCKALHPKMCQFAEKNPDVQFLQVNNEEHHSMITTLGIKVLPFFRFYKGDHGRVASFSCTVATLKKFKDAFAKHSPKIISLFPTKGLEEYELIALSDNKDLDYTYKPPEEDVSESADDEKLSVVPHPHRIQSSLFPAHQQHSESLLKTRMRKPLLLPDDDVVVNVR
ncbi:hypothetical protein ACFE04_023246 [Oxalis oulophora]